MDISNAQLRQFLNNYFDGDELRDLCFDYFPRVEQEFTGGMAKSDQIRLLLNHCRNHGERDRLIGALREARPSPFQQEFELAQPAPMSARVTARPASRNPRQIFISHAYEDAKLAHHLADDLQVRGWQVWLAPDSIQPGEKWVAAINRGLVESGVFLLLVSQHAVQSRWVNSEADIAVQWEHEGKMRFIPVQTSSRPLAHVPPMWLRHQDISFAGRYQNGLAPLLAKLEQRPYVPPPPPPSQRQKVMAFFAQIPMVVWGGVGILMLAVALTAWLLPLFGGGGGETTREPEATPATEVAIADTATPAPTRQPTLTPTIATATLTATDVPEATATFTVEPSDTPQPPTPPTATNDSNPPANASLHDTWPRPQDGMTMVFVPDGTFTMGSSETEVDDAFALCEQYSGGYVCQRSLFEDEMPAHEVQLDSFWLDQHEVTNAQFAAFLNDENGLQTDFEVWLEGDESNTLIKKVNEMFQAVEGFENHPVQETNWHEADAYCQWVGGNLPTEAQWEYAARGTDGRVYPWGNEHPNSSLLNYSNNVGAITVGSYSPQGDSWVDAQDMAGNVWEWTADWFGVYANASQNEPAGPPIGPTKVLRGGAWNGIPALVRSVYRNPSTELNLHIYNIGFRCIVPSN